jgi:hypothetical protein
MRDARAHDGAGLGSAEGCARAASHACRLGHTA